MLLFLNDWSSYRSFFVEKHLSIFVGVATFKLLAMITDTFRHTHTEGLLSGLHGTGTNSILKVVGAKSLNKFALKTGIE